MTKIACRKILIVDDVDAMRLMIRNLLTVQFEIEFFVAAQSGTEALKVLQRELESEVRSYSRPFPRTFDRACGSVL